jgi:hypothetical protein
MRCFLHHDRPFVQHLRSTILLLVCCLQNKCDCGPLVPKLRGNFRPDMDRGRGAARACLHPDGKQNLFSLASEILIRNVAKILIAVSLLRRRLLPLECNPAVTVGSVEGSRPAALLVLTGGYIDAHKRERRLQARTSMVPGEPATSILIHLATEP